jgi:hypothetical protein
MKFCHWESLRKLGGRKRERARGGEGERGKEGQRKRGTEKEKFIRFFIKGVSNPDLVSESNCQIAIYKIRRCVILLIFEIKFSMILW